MIIICILEDNDNSDDLDEFEDCWSSFKTEGNYKNTQFSDEKLCVN